jgi:hypothetical protein
MLPMIYGKPMLSLQVAWYLPLPTHSNKLALPTQKLTCLPSQKLTCKMMAFPSEVIPWDCGTCAYTNKDATCRNCIICQIRRPFCSAIVAGATAAATARMTRVDRCKQARIAMLAAAAPAVAGEVPNAANGPPAVAESAAIPPKWDP